MRTIFFRQVKSWTVAAVCNKFAVFTLWTNIMGFQWIYLGNTWHGSNKGRADRTTGTYLISVSHWICHQFLCGHIKHRETMFGNGTKFFIQTIFYQFRHRVAIDFFRFFPCNANQIFLRTVNKRREHTRRNRADVFHHICNFAAVGNNNFICFFFTQIRKFLQHFCRCTHV